MRTWMLATRRRVVSWMVALLAIVSVPTSPPIALAAQAHSGTDTVAPFPPLRGDAAKRHLAATGLADSLNEAIVAARYRVRPNEQRPGFSGESPAQSFTVDFGADATRLRTFAGGAGQGLVLRVDRIGYGDHQHAVDHGAPTVDGNRVEYAHSVTGHPHAGLTEWYVNRPDGLEHGFTLQAAPGKPANGERLVVAMKTEGDLRARTASGGQALEFVDRAGNLALRYDKLVVTDATGRQLNARMHADGVSMHIEVDDHGAVWPVTIDPTFTQQAKLLHSDPGTGDWFGFTVAIEGDTAAVGAFRKTGPGGDQGATYIFVRSGTTWTEQQKLIATEGGHIDSFGVVALSGNTLMVGTPFENGPGVEDLGAVYVFERSGTTWTRVQKLRPADASLYSSFGVAVALQGDTAVIGAHGDSSRGFLNGAAYVYVRTAGTWVEHQKLYASDAGPVSWFGLSIGLDGDTAVIGTELRAGQQGAAYAFVRSGGVWSEQQQLTVPGLAGGDRYGASVRISGNTIAIGAPGKAGPAGAGQGAVYVFVRSGSTWNLQSTIVAADGAAGDAFGSGVAIETDRLAIGAPGKAGPSGSGQGAAYVYERSGAVWTEQQILRANDGTPGDAFGRVALHGASIIVGAPFRTGSGGASNQGAAYVFTAVPANTAPVLTLKPAISMWPPNHAYQTVTVAQMVQSATDAEDGNVLNNVVIEKVASDEPDNGTGDGDTANDIAIAGNCKFVQLRRERSGVLNGRVYTVTLRVTDAGGASTRADFKVTVPVNNGGAATDSGVAQTVASACP